VQSDRKRILSELPNKGHRKLSLGRLLGEATIVVASRLRVKYRKVLKTVTYFAVSLNSCTMHNLQGWDRTLWKYFDAGWRLPQVIQADKLTFLVHV
jgi:hypothetical protein